jgi:hypothetical protein
MFFGIQRSFSSNAAAIIKIYQEVPPRNRARKSKFFRRLCRFQFGSKSAFEKYIVPDCFNQFLLNFPAIQSILHPDSESNEFQAVSFPF